MTLSPTDLAAIRQRANNATKGPWIVAPDKCGPEGQGVYETTNYGPICEVGDPYPRGGNRPQENMEFIAHAREDIPKLLAHIDQLAQSLEGRDMEQAALTRAVKQITAALEATHGWEGLGPIQAVRQALTGTPPDPPTIPYLDSN